MADTVNSRTIAEHLCTLASLLEAEAIRANTLGMRLDKDLLREAREVRAVADQLWESNTAITLDPDRDCAGRTGAAEATAATSNRIVAGPRRRTHRMRLV